MEVSVVALGCWAFAGDEYWGPQDDRDSIASVHAALDEGVNFFDTAEGYGSGHSERVLGRALKGRRHEAVIATKCSHGGGSAAELEAACARSLQQLETDYIDLYQIHWPFRETPLEETLSAFERLKRQGKIRAVGVCNFGARDLAALAEVGHCATNQVPYSLLTRAIEFEIQAHCIERDIGIICYTPLAQGLLTGRYATVAQVPAPRAISRHFASGRFGHWTRSPGRSKRNRAPTPASGARVRNP
jgi:aryl-alcohol dehydrogenase-like predicted oxidoreductase